MDMPHFDSTLDTHYYKGNLPRAFLFLPLTCPHCPTFTTTDLYNLQPMKGPSCQDRLPRVDQRRRFGRHLLNPRVCYWFAS
jgi:hypothetical protein